METQQFRARAPEANPPDSELGLSLVEVTIALVVTVVAIFGILMSLTSGHHLQRRTESYGRATRAAQQVKEQLRTGDLEARVTEFKASPTQTVGPVTVQVSFPEQLLLDLLGGPVPVGWRYRDTDADGEVDLDPAATATVGLVPVTVTTRWIGGESSASYLLTEK